MPDYLPSAPPPYEDTRGGAYNDTPGGLYGLAVKPPFHFPGTQLQIFPLRAKLNRLQLFIDQYLNLAPEEAGEFRVFSPYVYLVSIYYGQLSLDAANLGWIAQDELMFGIPLLWFKRVGGRLVFHDYACVTPFIYVDNDHSLSTGRETFGWPKNLVSAESLNAAWSKDPNASTLLMRFNLMVYSELYAGQRPQSEPLLELLTRCNDLSLLRTPSDSRASFLPWIALPNAITASLDMARDGVDLLRGLGFLSVQPGTGPDAYARMAAQALEMIRLRGPGLTFNTINLKQFRDAERPELAAYQAITAAPMQWRHIQRAGLLGEDLILRGDPSGGFMVNLYQYPTAPILQSLGLEFTDVRTIGARTVHTLRPVLPMWVEADLQYNLGQTLAWRSKDFTDRDGKATWYLPSGRTLPPRPTETECRFNTALGAAEGEIAGPFDFPDVTVRVMPLLAVQATLNDFLQKYLGQPLHAVSAAFTIEAWGRYVYLCAYSYQEMSSQTNDLGLWEERELIFYVPAVVRKDGEVWKIALVPVYAYANSSTAAVTGPEVNGIPVAKAILESPGDVWMNGEGPGNATMRTLLAASTTVLPAFGQGQEAMVRPFLEVFKGNPIPSEAREQWRGVVEGWGTELKNDLDERYRKLSVYCKDDGTRVYALGGPNRNQETLSWAFDVLAQKQPVRVLTLKQFRDAHNPQTACYQSIVEIKRTINHVHNISEIDDGLYVRIYRHPSLPIVEKLGLVPMMDDSERNSKFAQIFQPLRPFWIRMSLTESLGENLFVHAGSWRKSADQLVDSDLMSWINKHTVSILATRDGDARAPLGPRGLRQRVYDVSNPRAPYPDLTKDPPFYYMPKHLADNFDPQYFVEQVLGNYWERWDDECPWTRAFDNIRQLRDAACWGLDPLRSMLAEFDFFGRYRCMSSSLASARLRDWYYTECAKLDGSKTQDWADKVKAAWNHKRSRLYAVRKRARDLLIWQAAFNQFIPEDKWSPQEPWLLEWSPQLPMFLNSEDKVTIYDGLIDQYRKIANDESDACCRAVALKTTTKPAQGIRRNLIGNLEERELLFPRHESYDDQWYAWNDNPDQPFEPCPLPQHADVRDELLPFYQLFKQKVAEVDRTAAVDAPKQRPRARQRA